MKPVSTSTAGTSAQLKPVRSARSTTPRSRAPVAGDELVLERASRRAGSRRVDVVRPAAPRAPGRASRRRARADPTSRRRGSGSSAPPALVAETGALAVAAPVAGAVPRHRNAVAAREQQRARSPRDRERDRRLAGRAARILDLQLGEPGPIGSSWRPISGAVPWPGSRQISAAARAHEHAAP